MSKVHKHLYNAKEVKEERKRLYGLQEGVDPILGTTIKYEESVCDHSHVTHNTRAAIHRQSNSFEGRVYNAYVRGLKWLTDLPLPDILRNLATYLEQDYSNNPYHSDWIKAVSSKFNALNEKQKASVLKDMALPEGKNGKERKEEFRKGVLSRRYTLTQIENILRKEKDGK